MTRIRTSSSTEDPYGASRLLASQIQALGPVSSTMESSMMDPAVDAVATSGVERDAMEGEAEDGHVVEGTSPLHHPPTLELMNGVTITITTNGSNNHNNNNNNIGTTDEDDDKCSADKDGSDLRAIDFASATNHHLHQHQHEQQQQSEPQTSVLDFDGASAHDDDNDDDGHGMMLVDSLAVTAIAAINNSHSSNSNSCSNSSNSSSTSNSSNSTSSSSSSSSSCGVGGGAGVVDGGDGDASSSTLRVATSQPKHGLLEDDEEEVLDGDDVDEDGNEEEEDEEEEEEEEEDDEGEQEGHGEANKHGITNVFVGSTGVDESSDGKIMQTEDADPLLQETINALMNGTGGIEVVHSPPNTAATQSTGVSTEIAMTTELSGERPMNDCELDTDRNYECTYCGKLFTRSNTLAYHLKVHTGERPFKCKHCSKAFREQYRLKKHLKTHAKCRNRRTERQGPAGTQMPGSRVPNGREHLHRTRGTMAMATPAQSTRLPMLGGRSEDDGATGDSDRFFKHYELPDGPEAMKLEPDISLTEEGIAEVPDADAMLTEEVEVMDDDGPLAGCGMADETNGGGLGGPNDVTLADADEIRHQIIEERIKSLQREVHLVNQNLNRVESKVDGLTRIISLLIEKFEEDVDPATGQVQPRQVAVPQPIVEPETAPIVPVSSLTVVTQPSTQSTAVTTSPVSCMPQKATLLSLTSPTGQQNQQTTTVYTHVTTVGQPTAPLQQTLVPLKESRTTGNTTHYYQFTEPTLSLTKPTATGTAATTTATSAVTVTPSPSPTPPPSQTHAQLTLASPGGSATSPVAGGALVATVNGNQLLDTFPEIPELPLRTVGDFLDLNDHCTDNEQFLLQMMIRLHQEIHNSQPFQRNIKRMMEALVTYEVLCQFSWSGKSAINGQYTKYVFGNSLGIIDLLTKTLNLGKSAEEAEANQKPIFSAIQSFIKHSRQNMIRDSRKRRDPMRGGGGGSCTDTMASGGSGLAPDGNGGGAITFHLNGTDRFQTKLIKSEFPAHEQQELVNPF